MINLEEIDQVVQSGPFEPTWDSLSYQVCPDWYRDAKFGMFIHWGVYSVPAFGSRVFTNMYIQGILAMTTIESILEIRLAWATRISFLFTADRFDPASWLDLFQKQALSIFFPVAEHHDGFQMYASKLCLIIA